MSATGEVENAAVERPLEEAPMAEQLLPAEKPVKEKKPKAPKEKKPRTPKTAAHPPYFQMIKEALLALNEKGGSSPYAIAKYMEAKHKAVLPGNFRKILGLQLKNSASRGKLVKIKASYKLSEAGKEEKGMAKTAKAATEKKPKQAKSATAASPALVAGAPKAKGRKRKSGAEKKAAKKAGSKKTRKLTPAKAKQPKSIKSPAVKKAKKSRA